MVSRSAPPTRAPSAAIFRIVRPGCAVEPAGLDVVHRVGDRRGATGPVAVDTFRIPAWTIAEVPRGLARVGHQVGGRVLEVAGGLDHQRPGDAEAEGGDPGELAHAGRG